MLEVPTSLPVADADGALRRRPWCALIIFVTTFTCCSTLDAPMACVCDVRSEGWIFLP